MVEALSIQGVWKGFSRGGEWTGVLEDVSFTVEQGEIAAIVGGRLGGKTTLLRIAAGIERPDRGSVSLGSQRMVDLRDRSRARLLGHELMWIDREGPGLDLEVTKFVGWPLALHGRGRREAERLAGQALERVGAQASAGRRWGELSNWQRVLVGFARAFAGSPQVVVIDDLLDALGGRATEEASDLLRGLIEESMPRCAVLMSSSSEMDSAIFADQVYSLTRKGILKSLSAERKGQAAVIPFPTQGEGYGPRGVGSP